jgi:hypothetical protein
MPAFRSRNVQWRRSLEQLASRGGGIELSIAPAGGDGEATVDFVWRVRVVGVGEAWIDVEAPVVLGQDVPVPPGAPLVGAISTGPNRWVFDTECLGAGGPGGPVSRTAATLRLRMPEEVRRSRRGHLRVGAASLELPSVELWPLLDEVSLRPIERALELAADACGGEMAASLAGRFWEREPLRPSLGPRFPATLLNLGGGGVGLRIDATHASALNRHRRFWMVLDLRPESILPICASLRIAHLHLDASGSTYAGAAFDTAANPRHATLLARQILEAVAGRHRRAAA